MWKFLITRCSLLPVASTLLILWSYRALRIQSTTLKRTWCHCCCFHLFFTFRLTKTRSIIAILASSTRVSAKTKPGSFFILFVHSLFSLFFLFVQSLFYCISLGVIVWRVFFFKWFSSTKKVKGMREAAALAEQAAAVVSLVLAAIDIFLLF